MKNLILFSFILTLVTACDAPQRTRLTSVAGYGNNYSNTGGTTGWNQGTTNAGNNGGGTTTGGTMPPGFANCDITPKYYSAGMGYFGVCQSTLDETQIAMKPSSTDTSRRTCLIPTYKDSNGSSAYIGQPQCTYTTQNVVTQGQLPKNRNGFSGYPLNGLMMMKETSLTAYFACMDAYINYVSPACPNGAQTNQACDQYARNYMAQLCNDFKTTHSYIDIRLK